MYEIDHIFLLTDINAPVADQFVEAGLTEGLSRIHPGQGTTNRRFFFSNIMFEFLWVHDIVEVGSPAIADTHLLERWQGRAGSACPFGICFRPGHQAASQAFTLFPSWDYKPPYLPDNLAIQVADNASNLAEPFLFYLSWAQAPAAEQSPVNHHAKVERLTQLELTTVNVQSPTHALSSASAYFALTSGDIYEMSLIFDEGRQNKVLDLRPIAPLVLMY